MVMSNWLENWTRIGSETAVGDRSGRKKLSRWLRRGSGHGRRRRGSTWSVTAADFSSAVEVCEERVLLSATPVITQVQAQTDVNNAQAAFTSAETAYTTASQTIISAHDSAMTGHSTDFTNNVTSLGTIFDTAVMGIEAVHTLNVQTLQAGFDALVAGFESTLTANNSTSENTYTTVTAGHSSTFDSAVATIEAGLNATITAADTILDSAVAAATSLFNSTESTASGQYDSDLASADGVYETAVNGHDSWLQSQESAAFAAYDALAGDNPTGALGIYNATETTEAGIRDGVLSSYPNTTYDPSSVSSIDFDALWNIALSGVQTGLTAAETAYETAVTSAETAYQAGMNNASSTYSAMMTTADSNRDAAYAAADAVYNANTSVDWNDYETAVNGPGGIEETWQNSINAADAVYNSAVTAATSTYDSTVQAAQATLDAAIAAAHQEFDDWLNGNQPGQTVTATFTRTQTIDSSTSPPTVSWSTSSRVEWSPTEGTSTQSEFAKEPPVPAGYTLISTVPLTVGPITTITETYAAPPGGIGTGGATTLTPAHNNPWELAKIARTEFYIEEQNAYYDQYLVDMNAAQVAYDGAVASANTAYNMAVYGNATGGTASPGSPAEAFNNALTSAANAFSNGEQSAMTTYNTSMDGYYQAEMQYWEDMMNGLPATPPNPNDPAQFAKDYYVTTTALDVNYAVATGAAWTGWVAAQVAADTTRDNAIINATYQLGVDQANAANVLVTSQIAAEDVYAVDMINIGADYAIAVNEKSADIEGDIVNAETNFELAEHAAAQIAGKAVNLAEKDRAHDYADADETRAEALALEDEDLANDLAVEEEIRQNAYAAGEATWLLDEAAAHIASTSIAAAATSSFLTGLAGADFLYLTTAAPLITTATQAFNNLVDADYVAAFPGDADQAAVSGAWTSFFNAMAIAAQTAITTEASAYQAYINGMAADIQTAMNNMAGEATVLAGSYGAALVNLVSTVGSAATLHTSQAAAAGVVWVDTVATDVKNSEKSAANAWLVMADAGVDALKTLADDFSNHWNSFAHSYLGAAAAHGTNLINEDRLAATNASGELTTLAQGVAAEQHDRNLDALNEWLSAALALSPLDDALVNAWAVMESAWSIFYASDTHATTAAAPLSDFGSSYPSGASPMSGINHTFDLAANDDEVAMQAAVAAGANNSTAYVVNAVSGGYVTSVFVRVPLTIQQTYAENPHSMFRTLIGEGFDIGPFHPITGDVAILVTLANGDPSAEIGLINALNQFYGLGSLVAPPVPILGSSWAPEKTQDIFGDYCHKWAEACEIAFKNQSHFLSSSAIYFDVYEIEWPRANGPKHSIVLVGNAITGSVVGIDSGGLGGYTDHVFLIDSILANSTIEVEIRESLRLKADRFRTSISTLHEMGINSIN